MFIAFAYIHGVSCKGITNTGILVSTSRASNCFPTWKQKGFHL